MARAKVGSNGPAPILDWSWNGTDGDDQIVGLGTNNTIHGNGGNDHIIGNSGNDNLFGDDGDDKINAGLGDDHLTGGSGDDDLQGGNGVDTFHYGFTVTTESSTTQVTHSFSDEVGGFVDTDHDGFLEVTEVVHQYDAWLKSLGVDSGDLNTVVDVSNDYGSALQMPTVEGLDGAVWDAKVSLQAWNANHNVLGTRWYSDSVTVAEQSAPQEVVTSGDGNDYILDFHIGTDKLDFTGGNGTTGAGVTLDQFMDHFVVTNADVNLDGIMDTEITIDGDAGFSVALLGVVTTADELVATDSIKFA